MKQVILSIILLLFTATGFAAQAVLLVSLGMPDNVLKAYLEQSKQYDIPIAIRGFYTESNNQTATIYIGSFKDTVNRVKKLVQEKKMGGISVDPLLFRAFHIKVVPALVVYDDIACVHQAANTLNTTCPDNQYDVIFGNVPIQKLLSIVMQNSQSKKRIYYAKMLLQKNDVLRKSI